jgi:NRPS condensation-like uncharacterized protein
MNVIRRTSFIVLPSILVFGQQFEVASIKPSLKALKTKPALACTSTARW